MLMRIFKEDLNELRYLSYSWVRRLNIVKVPVLPQLGLMKFPSKSHQWPGVMVHNCDPSYYRG
jgi:hypothetical protein